MHRFKQHVRGNVVAYLALFVSLGGTSAYAANTIGSADVINDSLLSEDIADFDGRDLRTGIARADMRHNSVGSEQIAFQSIEGRDIGLEAVGADTLATDAVTNAKVADAAVGSAELADGAVRSNHVLDESLTGADIQLGGLTGADIAVETITGREVRSGSLGLEELRPIKLRKKTVEHNEFKAPNVTVYCPGGRFGLTGGAKVKSVDENVGLAASRPIFKDGTMMGWTARATEEDDASPNDVKLTVYVTCMP